MDPSFISNMPKVELDVHLEGTMEPSMVQDLATRNDVHVPSSTQDHTDSLVHCNARQLSSLFHAYTIVLITRQDFFDVCWSYLLKCRDQNIIHTEIFFDALAHTQRGLSFDTVISGLHDAATKADEELKVSVGFIIYFSAENTTQCIMQTLQQSENFKDWIVGVGLDSTMCSSTTHDFKTVVTEVKRLGYKLTCHCNIDQTDSIEHIYQAMKELRVDRLDHGVDAVKDERLIEEVVRGDIGLTCSPVSNSIVTKNVRGEDILCLLRRGVLISLSSTAPAVFKAYLHSNITKLAAHCYMWKSEVTKMQRNAIKIAWISEERRDRLMGTIQQWAFSMDNCG